MKSISKRVAAVIAVLLVSASLIPAMAQKVTLNCKDTGIETVLGSIQRQTGLRMVYSNQTMDMNRKVTINVKNAGLKDVMDELFSGTETVYEIRDNKIYLRERKAAADGLVRIQGVVTDENGAPVAGAYVQESGSRNNGTITDSDGKFEIGVGAMASLNVSFMGFGLGMWP